MFDLEMLTLGYSPLISDRLCEMTVYVRHILSKDYLAQRAYPFLENAFILGYSRLVGFDIETSPPVYDCCFRWIMESVTVQVCSSQHTWLIPIYLSFHT